MVKFRNVFSATGIVMACLLLLMMSLGVETACTDAPFENYMGALVSINPDVKLNDIMLIGSHDAATVDGHVSVLSHGPTKITPHSWAVTQTLTLEEQMCKGARVFDLRFTASSKPSEAADYPNWRIFHGPTPGFYVLFQTAAEIAASVNAFCMIHPTEIVQLRVKLDSYKKRNRIHYPLFIEWFASQMPTCVVPRGQNAGLGEIIGDRSIKEILNAVRKNLKVPTDSNVTAGRSSVGGAVILLNYAQPNTLDLWVKTLSAMIKSNTHPPMQGSSQWSVT